MSPREGRAIVISLSSMCDCPDVTCGKTEIVEKASTARLRNAHLHAFKRDARNLDKDRPVKTDSSLVLTPQSDFTNIFSRF